jgi:hypothetical protein
MIQGSSRKSSSVLTRPITGFSTLLWGRRRALVRPVRLHRTEMPRRTLTAGFVNSAATRREGALTAVYSHWHCYSEQRTKLRGQYSSFITQPLRRSLSSNAVGWAQVSRHTQEYCWPRHKRIAAIRHLPDLTRTAHPLAMGSKQLY